MQEGERFLKKESSTRQMKRGAKGGVREQRREGEKKRGRKEKGEKEGE